MHYQDPVKRRTFEAWKLRLLLFSGLGVLFYNSFGAVPIGLQFPHALDFYLIIASVYFAMNPQRRAEQYRDQVFIFVLFPGAFVTAILPFYSVILFVLQQG